MRMLRASLQRVLLLLLLLLCWYHNDGAAAFVVGPFLRRVRIVSSRSSSLVRLYDSAPSSSSRVNQAEPTFLAVADGTAAKVSTVIHSSSEPGVTMHTLTLNEHRPLGCTVEESLAVEDSKAVFVTMVKEDGFAQQAGLQVGDVILGMTGLFGQYHPDDDSNNRNSVVLLDESVAGRIDLVKKLVAARPDDEPLQLKVARGTQVLPRHEAALAELCANPEADTDEATEQCLLEYLQSGYYSDEENEVDDDDAVVEDTFEDAENCNPEVDEDCVLDSMYNLWAEDLPTPCPAGPSLVGQDSQKQESSAKPTVKPWSSRASPSGTWVRDPRTGEMRNIS